MKFLNWRIDNVKKWESILDKIGLLDSKKECVFVESLIKNVKFRAKLVWNKPVSNNFCHLEIKDSDFIDIEKANNLIIDKSLSYLHEYIYTYVF